MINYICEKIPMNLFVGKAVIIRWVVVAVIVMAAMIWGYFIMTAARPHELLLPVYGERNADSTDHTIPDFTVTSQDGKTVTQRNFKGKIYVSDFFFTTCQGICPLMSDQLVRVADRYANNDHVLLLSHTSKPEEDSLPVLKKYAQQHHADPAKWYFVTAPKKVINSLARNAYLVGGTSGSGDEEFVHTQYLVLVDPEKRIRGFYDGTDSVEVDKLIDDIAVLLKEE
jgi:protein SCO1/2